MIYSLHMFMNHSKMFYKVWRRSNASSVIDWPKMNWTELVKSDIGLKTYSSVSYIISKLMILNYKIFLQSTHVLYTELLYTLEFSYYAWVVFNYAVHACRFQFRTPIILTDIIYGLCTRTSIGLCTENVEP